MNEVSNNESLHYPYQRILREGGRKRYYLGPKHPNQYLTQREAECMLLMLQEFTNKEVAALLNLSCRTVEYYLKNMRDKLNCYNKYHLIRVIRSSDLLSVIDFNLGDLAAKRRDMDPTLTQSTMQTLNASN